MKQDSEILLSTTPSLDGYEITEYIDVISSETIYKLSIAKSFSSAISDVIDSWKIFSNNELSGTTRLIHEAKEYVKDELTKKARELGANAIVGIDFETSFSDINGYAKVSINGTAVKISKIDRAHFNETLNFSLKPNILSPFRPISVMLNVSNNVSAAIKIFESKEERISNFLADLSIRTIFDEEILLENIHFYSFTEESSKRLVSKFVEIPLSPDICHKIATCSIIVKKYISGKQLITVPVSELEALPDDVILNNPVSEYTNPVDGVKEVLPIIEKMNTAQEIYDYLVGYNDAHGHFIDPLLFDQLKKTLNIERYYGNAPDSALKRIKMFYDLQ